MSEAPAMPAQTPMAIVKAGMQVQWGDGCAEALAKCGINPDNFGTYDARAKAQKEQRDDYKKNTVEANGGSGTGHQAGCSAAGTGKNCTCYQSDQAQKDMGTQDWLVANSQSGHICQNAFFQSAGNRGDPCANVPPSGKGDAGSYGYQDNKALCMDHFGKSTDVGAPHYEITRREAENAKAMAEAKGPGGPVTPADMKDGVKGSAAIAVKGSGDRIGEEDPSKVDPKRKDTAEKFDQAQKKQGEELGKKNAGDASGAQGSSGGTGPGGAGGPGAGSPTPADQQKAIDCIVAAWEGSLDTMRQDLVNSHSAGAKTKAAAEAKAIKEHNKKNPNNKISDPKDLPPETKAKIQEQANAANQKQMDEMKAKGADSAGKAAEKPGTPSEKDCLDYQAAYLWDQQQKNGGKFPPMQGNVPGNTGGGNAGSGASGDNPE